MVYSSLILTARNFRLRKKSLFFPQVNDTQLRLNWQHNPISYFKITHEVF